jgi:hypothetical protein
MTMRLRMSIAAVLAAILVLTDAASAQESRGGARDQLHDDECLTFPLIDVADGTDVGVIERRDGVARAGGRETTERTFCVSRFNRLVFSLRVHGSRFRFAFNNRHPNAT